jgi:hypothetical protein
MCNSASLVLDTTIRQHTIEENIWEQIHGKWQGMQVTDWYLQLCESYLSELGNHLKLETHDHPNPYTIGWISKGLNTRITKKYNLPLSLGKYYRQICYVMLLIWMTTMFFLGDLGNLMWILHTKGKENSCFFTWNKRKITILPNQLDRNSSKRKGKGD